MKISVNIPKYLFSLILILSLAATAQVKVTVQPLNPAGLLYQSMVRAC